MLDGFARHGLFDLTVSVKGDTEVDSHHTIEDTGIVLGHAIAEALGDKSRHETLRLLLYSQWMRHLHSELSIFLADPT
mgnify:CR=1 FL=1